MRGSVAFLSAALAVLVLAPVVCGARYGALSQAAAAARSLEGDGSVGCAGAVAAGQRLLESAGEGESPRRAPWPWQVLHDRLGQLTSLRGIVMEFLPVSYYWVALGNGGEIDLRVSVWEFAVSYRGDIADHFRLVGEFTACESIADRPHASFGTSHFLPTEGELLILCMPEWPELEAWRVGMDRPTRRLGQIVWDFSLQGSRLIGETRNGAGLWNTSSWELLWQKRGLFPWTAAFAPVGDIMAGISMDGINGFRLAILDSESGRELCSASLVGTGLRSIDRRHRLSFTGSRLTVCDRAGRTSVTFQVDYTAAGCEFVGLRQRRLCDAVGSGLIFSHTGNQLSISEIGSGAGAHLHQAMVPPPAFTRALVAGIRARFSPDGTSVRMDTTTQTYVWPFAHGGKPRRVPRDVVYSADGMMLAGRGDGGLRLIAVASGSELGVTSAMYPALGGFSRLLAVSGPRSWKTAART